MKKSLKAKIVCLAMSAALCAAAGVACSTPTPNTPEKEPPKTENVVEKKTLTLSYDETSGVASWNSLEGATKYVVVVHLRHELGEVATFETTTASQQLNLEQGLNLITVYAYKEDAEIGVGTLIVECELDFIHPATPENVAYDKANGTLSWSAAENAAKYIVTVTGVTDKSFSKTVETAETSAALNLVGGVYEISVVAVNAQGSKGKTATIEYATYTSTAFNTDEDNDGVYDLFNFNESGVLDLTYSGEYQEWSSAVSSTATAKLVDRETLGEFTNETTDGALEILAPTQDTGTMSGITVRLPDDISVGVLRFDLRRQTGATTGVMLSDGKGHTAFYGGLASTLAWTKWETVSIDIEKFLDNNSDLECVREIGVYLRSTKGGAHYIDNLSYEKLGNVGEIAYASETKTLSWNKVFGATEYVVKQGDTELYRGAENSVVLENALDKDNALSATITVEATDGVTTKSKDLSLNFFGEIGNISMDKETFVVSWDEVTGATEYTLYLNGTKVYSGTNTSYQVPTGGDVTKDWTAKLIVSRGEHIKEKSAFVLCTHGTKQSFGELVPGTTDEHYIAEWHNLAAWGTIKYDWTNNKNTYTGGDENGVTLDVSRTYSQTKYDEGTLFVQTGAGWGNGSVAFELTTALNVSDIASITFKLKFAENKQPVFYINALGTGESNYIPTKNVNITTSEDWSIVTIPVSAIKALTANITAVTKIYLTTNSAYQLNVKEITYKEKGEEKKQSYGKLKTGTTNEYYIAEWSNPKEWGQFNQDGYTGGPEGSVTFTKGSWKVYSSGPMHTRIHEGYLHIYTSGGWAEGSLSFNLPTTLKVSEIESISFKLKFTANSGDGKARFYFNGTESQNYLDGSKSENVTTTTDGDWTIYTIPSAKISALGITDISKLYVSANAAYEMDIQEVTYTKAAQE